MKTKKKFDINRVKEFCKLINEGHAPQEALSSMKACRAYATPLKKAGFYWKEKDETYKAVERIYVERYEAFIKIRRDYHKSYNINSRPKLVVKQKTLFCQPKPKTTTPAPTMKAKQRELTFIQRVVKSLFKL
jgi:hypothetical protein